MNFSDQPVRCNKLLGIPYVLQCPRCNQMSRATSSERGAYYHIASNSNMSSCFDLVTNSKVPLIQSSWFIFSRSQCRQYSPGAILWSFDMCNHENYGQWFRDEWFSGLQTLQNEIFTELLLVPACPTSYRNEDHADYTDLQMDSPTLHQCPSNESQKFVLQNDPSEHYVL